MKDLTAADMDAAVRTIASTPLDGRECGGRVNVQDHQEAKSLEGKVDSNKLYPLADAITIVEDAATAKFDESIGVAVQLGIDAKKSDR